MTPRPARVAQFARSCRGSAQGQCRRVLCVVSNLAHTSSCLPAEKSGDDRDAPFPLTSLSKFKVNKVLDTSAAAKTAAVLGSFAGKEVSEILSAYIHCTACSQIEALQGHALMFTSLTLQGEAIIAVEKKPFDPDAMVALLGPEAELQVDFQNAEYGEHDCWHQHVQIRTIPRRRQHHLFFPRDLHAFPHIDVEF